MNEKKIVWFSVRQRNGEKKHPNQRRTIPPLTAKVSEIFHFDFVENPFSFSISHTKKTPHEKKNDKQTQNMKENRHFFFLIALAIL